MAGFQSDRSHPFYRPLWRRLLMVAVTAGWVVFEFLTGGQSIWLLLSIGIFGYTLWTYLITFPVEPETAETRPDQPSDR